MSRDLWILDLDVLAYAEALDLQRAVARGRIAGTVPQDVLLLVEHPPVVTLGRATKREHLSTPPELLARRGVELFDIERGGDVTFHGPGQLVGYPIFDLRRHKQDLHWYLRQVEEALIRALGTYGLAAVRSQGYTGVWTPGTGASHGRAEIGSAGRLRKIASIGVHARDWVTWHGFALNVATELSYFDLIVPCGIAGVDMTSMARELGAAPERAGVAAAVARAFSEVFSLAPVEVSRSRLGEALAGDTAAAAP
jgi:lipoyl(octanoyl) transferase